MPSDTAGKKITEDDEVATSFTVWVTPEEVESINTAVVYGGIRMYLKAEKNIVACFAGCRAHRFLLTGP